jgi:hypothetical protein
MKDEDILIEVKSTFSLVWAETTPNEKWVKPVQLRPKGSLDRHISWSTWLLSGSGLVQFLVFCGWFSLVQADFPC